jgi:hypothetical protein
MTKEFLKKVSVEKKSNFSNQNSAVACNKGLQSSW